MRIEDEHSDVLQNIETAIVSVYDEDEALLDFDVLDALAALIRRYAGEERGRSARDPHLSGRARDIFDRALLMCEWHLGRQQLNAEPGDPDSDETIEDPITIETLLRCLKRIRLSVEQWNSVGGRRGYLDYVRPFIHEINEQIGA